MLTLERRPGETIIIDYLIEVTVLNISGNHVQIGIEAPESVRILRKELNESKNSTRNRTNQPRH